ncbi:MAG: 6-carboxytetrahydropterin synthase [candidate division WOR-3 bacterium]
MTAQSLERWSSSNKTDPRSRSRSSPKNRKARDYELWGAEQPTPYSVRVRQSFSAAHALTGTGRRCEELHGHNYLVELTIAAHSLKSPGIVEDFVAVKEKLHSVLPDHKLLNDVLVPSPTAENIARYIYDRFLELCPELRLDRRGRSYLVSVAVWENEETCAVYAPQASRIPKTKTRQVLQ